VTVSLILFLPLLFLARYINYKIGYLAFVSSLFVFLISLLGSYDVTFPVFLLLLIMRFPLKRLNPFSVIFLTYMISQIILSIIQKMTSYYDFYMAIFETFSVAVILIFPIFYFLGKSSFETKNLRVKDLERITFFS